MVARNVAVAIPARDEEDRIISCLESLYNAHLDSRVRRLRLVLLANNCSDRTADKARTWAAVRDAPLTCVEVKLHPDRANAGWARRLAFDAAARELSAPTDALLCTDADTVVAVDWLTRTLDHLDLGYDAVAGFARLRQSELRRLPAAHRVRLARIRKYEAAFDYIRGHLQTTEPWPRHFYEGGASIALTLQSYRAIGGAPTPPVSEDKALFAALRSRGRRIRHARDVNVFTSCRLTGRAFGGAADTLAKWGVQGDGEHLWGIKPIATLIRSGDGGQSLTFDQLEHETAVARRLVRTIRDKNVHSYLFDHSARRQTSSR